MGSNEILAAIVEGFPMASFVIDAKHRVSHWNRACEILTGFPKHQMIGTTNQWQAFYSHQRPVMADLVLHGVDEHQVVQLYPGKFCQSCTIPGTYEAEDFFPNLGESGRWLYFTAAPLCNEQGIVIGAIETLQDISERRRSENALKESEERFKTLSRTDPLTQLFNFRDFYEQLEHEIERTTRHSRPLSLAIIDIDHFKGINDHYGHLEGDRVLRQLGSYIQDWKRSTDKAFRYGGDEFAILMPETVGKHAQEAAQRLLRHLASLPEGDASAPLCTLSIGVSQFLQGEKAIDLVQRADEAVYQAKKCGRNRVVKSEGSLAEYL
jgi:diguanylate cyclase (GGDEF)-like protein